MLTEDVINNLIWIDDAFSKDYIDELEAACCLTEGQNRVYFGYKVSGYFIDFEINPILRRNFRVITTWNYPRRCLFDFIDRAIAKNLQNFRSELLLGKCEEIFLSMSSVDQEIFISNYFYIYQELGLFNLDPSEKKSSWIQHARDINKDLLPINGHLNKEQMGKLIHQEMKKRLLDGDTTMAKRGGKLAPTAQSITRHALQNLD